MRRRGRRWRMSRTPLGTWGNPKVVSLTQGPALTNTELRAMFRVPLFQNHECLRHVVTARIVIVLVIIRIQTKLVMLMVREITKIII